MISSSARDTRRIVDNLNRGASPIERLEKETFNRGWRQPEPPRVTLFPHHPACGITSGAVSPGDGCNAAFAPERTSDFATLFTRVARLPVFSMPPLFAETLMVSGTPVVPSLARPARPRGIEALWGQVYLFLWLLGRYTCERVSSLAACHR